MCVVGMRHVGITVSDMVRSLRFYCEYLGFKQIGDYPACAGLYYETLVGVSGALIDIKILAASDGSKVELLQYRSHTASSGLMAQATEAGRPHMAFTVDNLARLYERRDLYGCKFKSGPLRSPDGSVIVAYCHDPDGSILELVQPQGAK